MGLISHTCVMGDIKTHSPKIIFGIDFGTTRCGLAYGYTAAPEIVYTFDEWPEQGLSRKYKSYCKAPISLLYVSKSKDRATDEKVVKMAPACHSDADYELKAWGWSAELRYLEMLEERRKAVAQSKNRKSNLEVGISSSTVYNLQKDGENEQENIHLVRNLKLHIARCETNSHSKPRILCKNLGHKLWAALSTWRWGSRPKALVAMDVKVEERNEELKKQLQEEGFNGLAYEVCSHDLPPGMTVERAISDYLAMLSTLALEYVQSKYNISVQDIQWCMTVPAAWGGAERQRMQRCAERAGMVYVLDSPTTGWCRRRPHSVSPHPLVMVLESEAVATAVYSGSQGLQKQLMVQDDQFLVVHIEDAFVDVVKHRKTNSSSSRLMLFRNFSSQHCPSGLCEGFRGYGDYSMSRKMQDRCLSIGGYETDPEKPCYRHGFHGLCGGRDLNTILVTDFLASKIPCFLRYLQEHPITIIPLLQQWEDIKASYDDDVLKTAFKLPPTFYETVATCEKLPISKEVEVEVEVTVMDMQRMLEPMVRETIDMIHAIVKEQEGPWASAPKIKALMLAGGLSSHPYLVRRVREALNLMVNAKQVAQGVEIMSGPEPSTAMCRGAVMLGMSPETVCPRIMIKSYGIRLSKPVYERDFAGGTLATMGIASEHEALMYLNTECTFTFVKCGEPVTVDHRLLLKKCILVFPHQTKVTIMILMYWDSESGVWELQGRISIDVSRYTKGIKSERYMGLQVMMQFKENASVEVRASMLQEEIFFRTYHEYVHDEFEKTLTLSTPFLYKHGQHGDRERRLELKAKSNRSIKFSNCCCVECSKS